MSYNVYVTRKDDWSDDDGPDITLNDWLDYLAIDGSLIPDSHRAKSTDPRVASGAKEATHAYWAEWPGRDDAGHEVWFWLELGNIICANADTATLRKLFVVADVLGARLQGDEGEFYDSVGRAVKGRPRMPRGAGKRPWWKFW